MKMIMETVFGSALYGTNTPTSDTDLKGIMIPSYKDILLQRAKKAINEQPDKLDGEKNSAGDIDREIFSLQYFFKLLTEGQSVALELLFAPPSAIIDCGWEWRYIVANREKLVCKKVNGFMQYCMKQAKKYGIKGSRVAAIRLVCDFLHHHAKNLDPRKTKLECFTHVIDNFCINVNNEFINRVDIVQNTGLTVRYLEVCDRKLQYTGSLQEAINVADRLLAEYGQRALMAETNQGIDWKALHHAVRVGEQAIELLDTGFITFPRPNRDDLLKIKTAQYSYLPVAERIENLCDQVVAAAGRSNLPENADEKWVDEFIINVYSNAVFVA